MTGPKSDVVMGLRQALQEPALRQALATSFSEPITTIRLTPSRDGTCGMKLRNGELEITYQDRFRDRADALHSVVQQICSRAVIEVTLTALSSFVPKGVRDPFLFEKLKPFLEGALRSPVPSSHEQASALIDSIIASDPQLLVDRAERLIKRLKKVTPRHTPTPSEATQKIDSAGALTSQLLALTFLISTPASLHSRGAQPRASTTLSVDPLSDIDAANRRLALDIAGLWPQAMFDGNGHIVITLQQRMQRTFETEGFQRLMARKQESSTAAGIGLLFRDDRPRLQQSHPSLHDVNSMLAQRIATVRVDQELRSWSTHDPDRFGLLRERLLDLTPHVPSGLRELRQNLPTQVPEALSEFIKAICLLRLHGGPDGLAHFSSLACPLTESERKTFNQITGALTQARQRNSSHDIDLAQDQLSAFFAARTEQHISTYVALVEFLAKWPLCETPEERAAISSAYKTYLTEVTTSVLFTITKGLEESFRDAIAQGAMVNPTVLAQFRSDIIGLAQANTDLENSTLSEYIIPITTSLLDLLTILEVRALPEQEHPQHLATIREILIREKKQLEQLTTPSFVASSAPGFTEMVVSLSQGVYDSIEGPLKQNLATHTAGIIRVAETGDIDSFAPTIKAALHKLSAYQHLDSYQQFVELINSRALAWTNEIGTLLSQILDAMAEQLRNSNDWPSVIANVLPSVRWHIRLSYDLREAFSAGNFPFSSIRVNHINGMVDSMHKRIGTTLLADEKKLLSCALSLTQLLHSGADQETVANVRTLLTAPLLPNRFSNKQTFDGYTKLREALAQYNQ